MFLRSVDVFLPKFSISAEASLGETLKELGITDAFADNADFSGMSEEVKLKVSKVGSAIMPHLYLLLELRVLMDGLFHYNESWINIFTNTCIFLTHHVASFLSCPK